MRTPTKFLRVPFGGKWQEIFLSGQILVKTVQTIQTLRQKTSVAVGASFLIMMEKFPCGKFKMTTVNLLFMWFSLGIPQIIFSSFSIYLFDAKFKDFLWKILNASLSQIKLSFITLQPHLCILWGNKILLIL